MESDLEKAESQDGSITATIFRTTDRYVFHNERSDAVHLSQDKRTASRQFLDMEAAIVFSDQPLQDNELFEVRIDEDIELYDFPIEIGVTANDPPNIPLPPTMNDMQNGIWMLSGNDVIKNGTIIKHRYGELILYCLSVGAVLGVARTSSGNVHFFINGEDQGVAASGIPQGVYAIVDIHCSKVSISSPAVRPADLVMSVASVTSNTDDELQRYSKQRRWIQQCRRLPFQLWFQRWFQQKLASHDKKEVLLFVNSFGRRLNQDISTCDGCNTKIQFYGGIRYYCMECECINLCNECFKRKKTPKEHQLNHTVAYMLWTCDGKDCDGEITGTRFHCLLCDNFDLCLGCKTTKNWPKRHAANHSMRKYSTLMTYSVRERETQKLVQETVKCGEKKNNRISVLFIGQDGVGKTSLKKSLLGEQVGDKEASTVGIEFNVIEVKDNNKHEAWQRAADQQYIASEEYKNLVLGKEVARKITESNLKESEVQNEMVKEKFDESGGEAVTVESYFVEEVNESESVDKDEGDNVNRGSTKVQDEYSMRDDLKRKIKESIGNYSDDAMDTIRFLFGDTGGQSVFYDVHSIMLRLRSLYIFVFDLGRPLHAKALSKFVCEKTKKVREVENRLGETNLDYMKKWAGTLRNLNSQCDQKTDKNSAPNSNMPKIIVAFTKPDTLGSVEEVEEVKQKAETALMTSFRDIGCESLIVGTYVIKNTLPRTDAETRELVLLREKIFETAQEILKAQDKTPVSWLELERAFSDRLMKSKGNPCITHDEAEKLAEEFEVKETFCQAMEFFHEENIVVHFGGHQASSNLVVLDPAWLVRVLTQVITVPPNPNSGGTVKAAWNDLETKGVLRSKSLPVVLDGHGQKEAVMKMMLRAGLICHWKEDIYFVPNMVTKVVEKQEIQTFLSNCLQPSLYIDFLGDCIPLGFYTRFQLEFMKWAKIDNEDDESDFVGDDEYEEDDCAPPEFTCNFSRFPKEENGVVYDVILVRHITRIQVAILADEWGNIARSVLSFVRDIMKIIPCTYPNYLGMRYKVGLKCDLCCEETTPCARHQKEGCTDDDCVCILSLRHLLKKFPTCKKTRLNYKRSVSELKKSPWVQAEVDKRVQNTIPPAMPSLDGVLDPRKYVVVKQIGCGSCGKVYLCQTKDRLRKYAVKQVEVTDDRETQQKVKDLKKEIQMLKRLKHNNIVAFYFHEETDRTLSMFMEYVPGGSIADYVMKNGEMQEKIVRKYTFQILKGCEYLHKKNVIHKDIKGANVLIDDAKGSIRLSDFGIAKDLQRVVTSTGSTTDESLAGTIYWCSPEHLKKEDPTYVFDIWSVGCTVVEMLTTKPPNRDLDYFQAMYSILNAVFYPPDHLSLMGKTFIELCFKKKGERPNATDLLENEFPAEYV